GSQISAQRNSSELGHGLLSCWISSYHHHGLEYPGSNGSDREDNMGYCFNAEFAGPERDLVPAIEDRGLKTGKAMFQELTGLKKPILDKDHILHWHVLLLYAEVMSSDFIKDFCGTDITSRMLICLALEQNPLRNYVYPWPTVDETIQILKGQEEDVRFTTSSVTWMKLCDRFLPDKAIDLIDEAGSRVRLQEARELEKELRQITKEKNEAVCYVHTTHTLTSRQAYNGQSSKLKVMRRGETEIFCRYTDNRPKQPLWSTSTNLICWPDPGFVHTGFLKTTIIPPPCAVIGLLDGVHGRLSPPPGGEGGP
ncbi:tetratricopeptide repeat protein 4, partial [Tanacetum coccineum]